MGSPLVSIVCTAYNHEKYIRDCIEGFLIQRTNFPFEVLINEDASTDHTASIIKEYEARYPHIIKPIYQTENQFSKRVGLWRTVLFPKAQGKYIAMCEGDDYWTDPLKLQKQIDFLEDNEDYILTCGGFKSCYLGEMSTVIEKGIVSATQESSEGFTFMLNDANKSWFTKTLTTVFRNKKEIYNKLGIYKRSRDLHLFYHLLKNGKGYYFKQVFGVYNIHPGGISSLKSIAEKLEKHYLLYQEMYMYNHDEYSRSQFVIIGLRLLNYKLSFLAKGGVSGFTILREVLPIVTKKQEKILLFKAFIPRQIQDVFHHLKGKYMINNITTYY